MLDNHVDRRGARAGPIMLYLELAWPFTLPSSSSWATSALLGGKQLARRILERAGPGSPQAGSIWTLATASPTPERG